MINGRINTNGQAFIQSISECIKTCDLTQSQIHTILSLQDILVPYSRLPSREIQWIIPGKKKHGGHMNLRTFKEKFFG